MKKVIFIIIAILLSFVVYARVNGEEYIRIPSSAIRFRVIANSNSVNDQHMKKLVKETVQLKLFDLLKDIEDINEARKIIDSNFSVINKSVEKLFLDKNYNMVFDIKFGKNHFPMKEFKGILYDEGNYESLVISIGEASGDNWWCVLFPPLCLMEVEESTEVEYKFWVKEWLDKIFKN